MLRVLVVDDSHVERCLIQGFLVLNADVSVESATDGEDAFNRILKGEPDAVVTDLRMPKVDGLQLVRRMVCEFPHIPVVLVTAHGSESLAMEALESGAASYVPKVEMPGRLLRTVKQVVARSRAARHWEQLMTRATQMCCTFELESDLGLIDSVVGHMQQVMGAMGVLDVNQRLQVGVALHEVLQQAMLRGNLELDEGEAAEAARTGFIPPQVVARLHESPLVERRVRVEVQVTRSIVTLNIRSEGREFLMAGSTEQTHVAEKQDDRTRSWLLARCFMDQVEVNAEGNQVVMTKASVAVANAVAKQVSACQFGGGRDLLSALLNGGQITTSS